jgi:hypothetical protein
MLLPVTLPLWESLLHVAGHSAALYALSRMAPPDQRVFFHIRSILLVHVLIVACTPVVFANLHFRLLYVTELILMLVLPSYFGHRTKFGIRHHLAALVSFEVVGRVVGECIPIVYYEAIVVFDGILKAYGRYIHKHNAAIVTKCYRTMVLVGFPVIGYTLFHENIVTVVVGATFIGSFFYFFH